MANAAPVPLRDRPHTAKVGDYEHIRVKPISGLIGCEISGVDLNAVSPSALVEIKRAFAEHLVVVFRDQYSLTRDNHIRFARNFGDILRLPHFPSVEGYPDIGLVHKDGSDDVDYYIGEAFHCDSTFLKNPPTVVVMRAVTLPPFGGDTAFANLFVAYETLSEGMRRVLDGLRVFNSDQRLSALYSKAGSEAGSRDAVHPLIVKHPVSGRRSIFLNRLLGIRFEDMTEADSAPLLDYLVAHSEFLPFTVRVRWEPGTVVLWDNWAASHSAIGDYKGYTRTMERVTLYGPRPTGV